MCTPATHSELEQVVMSGETAGDGEKEKEYCTCVFQCGNGVWKRTAKKDEDGGWTFEKGCKKYCHAGVCDSQGA
jgi:hypothetical protein